MSNPTAAAGAAADARARQNARAQHEVIQGPAPAGFETLYVSERSELHSSFEAFALPLHWSLVRGGLRLRITDTVPTSSTIPLSELTEILPLDWKSKITTKQEEGSDLQLEQLVLRYWDHTNSSVHYEAKIIEVVKNNAIVVILFRATNGYGMDGNVQVTNKIDMDSNSPGRNSSAANFQLCDFVATNVLCSTGAEDKTWNQIYRNLPTFEKIVWNQLMDPIGLQVAKARAPNENSKAGAQNQSAQNQQQQQQQQPVYNPAGQAPPPLMQPYPSGGIGGPLFVPPAVPAGGGGLGRSDMDPVGGFGAGNVADPRGFRAPPTLPFGGGMLPPPPGARFDPFGPPNPMPAAPRPQPGPGTGGGNWAVPNPDAEQPPPGFEDMFM